MPAKNLITFRRGTASQWANSTQPLSSGEPGFDLTNNILKIGDGTSLWSNLKSVVDINSSASISGTLVATSGNFPSGVIAGTTYITGSLYANTDIWVKSTDQINNPSIMFFNPSTSAGVAGISCSSSGSYIDIGLSDSFNTGNTARFVNYEDNSGRIVLRIDSIEAEAKYFKIKHPDLASGYSYLQYGSLESPYNGVRLTGKGELKKGICKVQLPSYIKYLVNDKDMNIQITNKGHHKILYVDSIDIQNNQFTVKGYRAKTGGPFEFFWTFTGVRQDIDPLIVEQ